MSYGEIDADPAPKITRAFFEYLGEGTKLSSIAVAVYNGVEPRHDDRVQAPTAVPPVELLRTSDEMIYARVCDNFQTYIADLLLLIFEKHPNAFYKRQFDARIAFETNDLESFRRAIVEEQVGDLSYKSLEQISEFVEKNTGFKLFASMLSLYRTYKILNVRNIITHNRGIINRLYASRSRSKPDTIGSKVNVPQYARINRYLIITAKSMDARACEKFVFNDGQLLIHKN